MVAQTPYPGRLTRLFVATLLIVLAALAGSPSATVAQSGGPMLSISHSVSQEPLLGGQVAFALTVRNGAVTPVTDRGYNLTITDTLPVGLTFVSADITPTSVVRQADGTTQLIWDNVVDLEANESISVGIVASLANTVTVATDLTNRAAARVNRMPDNSGAWVQATSQLSTRPQALDIETSIIQSTSEEQATGAGEYPAAPGRGPNADWPFQVRVMVRNNNVGPTTGVMARVTLPPGVAYLGNVSISPNPNNVSTTPALKLKPDGSLDLSWSLGNFAVAQHAAPVVITFQAAIPYQFRTASEQAARNGPFAGPMKGDVIPEDTVMSILYEATGAYATAPTADGSESTPLDDAPAQATAEILTVKKSAAPATVGTGTVVTYTLNYYVSEYYKVTNGTLVDVLPDGMTYVDGSANLAPASVAPNSPAAGQTTITWNLPENSTGPGLSAAIAFRAVVDPTYEAAPLTGQPIVSGDSLTNRVTVGGDWTDMVNTRRSGTVTPDTSAATIATRMPSFNKVVRDPNTQQWVNSVNAFVGDTLTFRLTYASAADVDAKSIVIRDFLPRGMTFVNGSAVHSVGGSFSDAPGCTSAPQSPTVGTLGGLQYLEWRLCNAGRGATWEAQIQALVGPVPNVQPGWIVANFGKLSGANSYGKNYSLRAMAMTNYRAPRLVLTKTATPGSGLDVNSTITYKISVANTGDATAYNLVVTDTLPVSLTLLAASGGTATPTASSYSTIAGNPAAGLGGTVLWTTVASLAPGKTQTFTYQAKIQSGLPPGAALTNIASVAYNSRADNQGHAVPHSSVLADDQTDDMIVYVKNLTIVKTGARLAAGAAPEAVTIGDKMRWTLTVTVPAGVVAYWPVIEENDLPVGFDYVANSRTIAGATFDDAHHPQNPKISPDHFDLRIYLNTLDNTAGQTPYTFTVGFDTLVTGVKFNQPSTVYYPNNMAVGDAINTAFIAWYDKASGYNNTGFAWDGFETNRINRRSPRATFTAKVRQPYLTLEKVASNNRIGAGDEIIYTVVLRNQGSDAAYDMKLRDVLPAGLTFQGIDSIAKPDATTVTPATASGAAYAFWIDRLDAGASVTIVYRVRVDDNVLSDSSFTNTVSVESYSTMPGTPNPSDSNGDGVIDERIYEGPRTTASVHTPQGSIRKIVSADELTFGSTIVYSLTVPAEPINATMANVVVTDTIDGRLEVVNVQNGSATGNDIYAAFSSIAPNTQQVVAVTVRLPDTLAAAAGAALQIPEEIDPVVNAAVVNPLQPGALLYNRGWLLYDKGGLKPSNIVSKRIVAAALVVDHQAAQIEAASGDLIDYTVSVQNAGNGRAENLMLTVALPENIQLEPASAKLNGAAFQLAGLNGIALPALPGQTAHVLTFQARMLNAEAGVGYTSVAAATATDSRGQPIPADNSVRVAADSDPDDTASTLVYGPLEWEAGSTFAAYEDQKNVGWSDWDYNDFIVKIDVAKGKTAAGQLAALRLNYEAIARGAAYDHSFMQGLPLYGGGSYAVVVRDADGKPVSSSSGSFVQDEPAFPIFGRTHDALPMQAGISDNRYKLFTNTAPVQTWVQKGYTAQLQVVLAEPQLNPLDSLPPIPWDPYLYVKSTAQEIHLVQPGHTNNTQVVNSSFDPTSPLIGFDLPLAHVFETSWKWPQEFLGIWHVYPDYVQYELSDGFKNQRWWDAASASTNMAYAWQGGAAAVAAAQAEQAAVLPSRYYASPVTADLDGDGRQEIIVGNLVKWQLEVYDSQGKMRAGWPQLLHAGVKSSAVVTDLDGNGTQEILVGDLRGYLYAFNADGAALPGWPIKTGVNQDADYRILARPLVIDLAGNGTRQIVLALSDSKLYVYEANGMLRSGWPVSLGDAPDVYGSHVVDSAPVAADIDGDQQLEIVVGSYDHNLYVYKASGALAWKYATRDVIMGTPAVGDIAPGLPGLEIVIGSGDRFVYLLDGAGNLLWRRATGWIVRSSPLLADLTGDGLLEIVIGSDDHKVWAWLANGDALPGWPQSTGAAVASSPTAGDIDNDGQLEIIAGSDDGNVYAWNIDGTAAQGWPKATGYPVKSTPALINADGDPEPEIVATTYQGALKILAGPGTLYLPLVRR